MRNAACCCTKYEVQASLYSYAKSPLTCWGQDAELVNLAAAKICFSYFTCL